MCIVLGSDKCDKGGYQIVNIVSNKHNHDGSALATMSNPLVTWPEAS